MSFDTFIEKASQDLTANKDVQDISGHPMCLGFNFVGLKSTIATIDMIAIVNGDSLTRSEMLALTEKLFKISKSLKKEFDLGLLPNPNALLCFVFSENVPEGIVEFIQKNCISHAVFYSGVVVSWVLDLKNCTLFTHNEWVSKIPPVKILTKFVFPGVNYLKHLIEDSTDMEFDPIATAFLIDIGKMALQELREKWKLRRQKATGEEIEIDLSKEENVVLQVESLRGNIDYQLTQEQINKISNLIMDSYNVLISLEERKKADLQEYDLQRLALAALNKRQEEIKERKKQELLDIEKYLRMLDFRVSRQKEQVS